jgi:hypothetical protein
MMEYKELFIFVEGDDDELFFAAIKEEVFGDKYYSIKIIKYAQKPLNEVKKCLAGIKALGEKGLGVEYIFVADADKDRFPCITARKEDIKRSYPFIDEDRILIVEPEIESWYLAGVDDVNRRKLRIKPSSPDTNTLTKEQFDKLIPRSFISRKAFLQALLDYFALQIARQNNRSFAYFLCKFN